MDKLCVKNARINDLALKNVYQVKYNITLDNGRKKDGSICLISIKSSVEMDYVLYGDLEGKCLDYNF